MHQTFGKLTIRGTVTTIIEKPKVTIFTVATSRKTGAVDFPRFIVFKDQSETRVDFAVGDRITVEAHFFTSKKHPEGTLVPDTISVERSKLDAVFAGEQFLLDENIFAIRGVIAVDVYAPAGNIALTSIIIQSGEYKSFIPIVAFNTAASALKQKEKGNLVNVIGYVQTKPASEVKNYSHTQSFVVTAIR